MCAHTCVEEAGDCRRTAGERLRHSSRLGDGLRLILFVQVAVQAVLLLVLNAFTWHRHR